MGPEMTSSLRHKSSRRGFTLVELLVVIGIILLLISILVPMLNKAYQQSVRTNMAGDLQVISQALEVYHDQFGVYPKPDNKIAGPYKGSIVLCWALIAPGRASQDGADGPGFRVRGTQGEVKGPYLPADRFKILSVDNKGNIVVPTAYDDHTDLIADRYGVPILYFARNSGAVVNSLNSYVGQGNPNNTPDKNPRYDANDGNVGSFNGIKNMQKWMPGVFYDPGADKVTYSGAGVLDQPYLLWSAGPDTQFGTDDDVTNFR